MPRESLLLLAAVLAWPMAAGCNTKPAVPAGGPAPGAGPQITVVKPEMRPVRRAVEQPGAVQAFEETALYANLTGYVGAVADDPEKVERIAKNTAAKEWPEHDRFIDIGSRVKKNWVLARLTVPELDEEVNQKEALVRQAAAEVVQAEKARAAATASVASATAAVAEAEAGVDRAQALYERAQKEVDRVAKLLTGGVGDLQTRDETLNQFKAAEATRKEANARVVSARAGVRKTEADEAKSVADVDAAKARAEVAAAGVARVKALRGYTEIKAPFDGVITRRGVNPGNLVSAGDKTALFVVARIDPVRVVVQVPEADTGLVSPGGAVRLSLQSGSGEEAGKVTRTSWSLEPGSRTLRTEIDVPNPKGLLRPGMYAYARLTAELPAAWSVQTAAVGKVNDEPVMYLVEGGKAVRVVVELLRGDSQFTQVRRYKKPGASDWTDVTGAESIATPAASLTDGRPIP